MVAAVKSDRKGLLAGLFADGESAERAFRACIDRGYATGRVNVVVSEATRQRLLKSGDKSKTRLAEREAEGGELGGPSGGRVGILVTILAAVGAAVAVPAFGFAAGPVAIALTAAGAAGATAGLIAALGDWGVPPDRIEQYRDAIKKGAILIFVETRSNPDARQIAREWKDLGGRDIHQE